MRQKVSKPMILLGSSKSPHLAAYLARINTSGPTEPTLETLRTLHRAHLMAVPFENLDIHLKRPIVLDAGRMFEKIVGQRRGGFCFEQNGLFAEVLRALGFDVSLLAARVSNGDGTFGPEFEHVTLLVKLDAPYLADVGFGEAFREPLRLVENVEQVQPMGVYRLMREGDTWRYETRDAAGAWQLEYIFWLTPYRLADFAGGCEYHQTSPESHFTQKRFCTLATPDGRITLRDDRLIVTSNGQREEHPIASEAEYTALLAERFGITITGG